MASNVVLASSQQPKKGDLSLFALSDVEIMNQIYATHVHNDEKFDVESLFIVVENILKRATQIVDNVVLGTPATVEHLEEKTPKAGFSPPLCTLKSISCEMQCKAPGEATAYKTTLSILNKLSNYSWDTKAVLTLAAFALDYGEFWLLAQSQSTDQLAKSVGTLRRVSVLLKRPTLQKHRQALIELNTVIKSTLEVIECIFELEKLSNYDTKDVPALSTGMDHIPVDVFWAIVTVVASTTQLCCLRGDYDKKQELSQFSQKLNVILTKLKRQITICRQQIEETEAYWKLTKLFRTPTEIMEVFKGLIYSKDNGQPLVDGSTKKPVNIDILKRKNVLLFISGLDITDEDISILRPIYDSIRKDNQYKIVWIPIVDQWTDDLQKKFEFLRSKMPWYVVQCFSPIAGIRFVKEKWHFKGKPSVVVLNPQGKVEHENAIHMIRVWGIKAFPFTTVVEETLSNDREWIGSIATNVHPNIDNWIKDQKYIFFYGGKDNEWIQQFTKRATALANDATIKEARISIELVSVGKGSKGEDHLGILGKFWTGIESLFISKTHRKTDADSVTLEIQKLLSYKNESGWAVLSKGSNVVLSGHGTTILKVVEEFDKWKEFVREKGFEFTFKEYHNKVLHTAHICCRIDIPNTSGRIPENMKCPNCPRIMETYISFKCCHIDGAANGVH
ncbi:protein SIEVE ELEMENT OCCLUSION B-like [Alnus glutinosa]|uniref:protein SIEVE ELEMENT OCCLUSION B-like n=1 Tax=Alnus glutinosa TaxID=3517 RepID=UPI002D76C983|nr:protein SIEVE ELEMENT OCCLUSION B-like [Alnus glutinosa]